MRQFSHVPLPGTPRSDNLSLPPWLTSAPIAHRGLHDEDHAENSLAAFGNAASLRVPFEFDVQLTRDGHPVVLHDRDLTRVVGRPTPAVDALDLGEVRKFRVRDLPIPTLDEVLELVDGSVPLVVDVRRWGFSRDSRLEQAVADRISGYSGEAVVQSFDPFAVLRLRKLLPGRAVGQISGALPSAGPIMGAIGRTMVTNVAVRPDFLVYELSELPSRWVSFWRARGLPLVAFTAHNTDEERRARDLADNFLFAGYLPEHYRLE
jgi:glycerophosphoryl diester phosphodiesterase